MLLIENMVQSLVVARRLAALLFVHENPAPHCARALRREEEWGRGREGSRPTRCIRSTRTYVVNVLSSIKVYCGILGMQKLTIENVLLPYGMRLLHFVGGQKGAETSHQPSAISHQHPAQGSNRTRVLYVLYVLYCTDQYVSRRCAEVATPEPNPLLWEPTASELLLFMRHRTRRHLDSACHRSWLMEHQIPRCACVQQAPAKPVVAALSRRRV